MVPGMSRSQLHSKTGALRGQHAGRPSKWIYGEAEALLSGRGIVADALTFERLARAIVDARPYAEDVGLSLARGDWSPEPHGTRFPLPSQHPPAVAATPTSTATLTTDALMASFVRENPQTAKGMAKRQASLRLQDLLSVPIGEYAAAVAG
ncbi:MAG: hypothetical protein JWR10_2362 [Rubritepida sp.]|nr:hypothetical protein [Rubritepida sp.]